MKSITKVYTVDTDDLGDFLLCIDDDTEFDYADDTPATVKVYSDSRDTFRLIERRAIDRGIAYKSTLYIGGEQ
jgi:hypothetical protein